MLEDQNRPNKIFTKKSVCQTCLVKISEKQVDVYRDKEGREGRVTWDRCHEADYKEWKRSEYEAQEWVSYLILICTIIILSLCRRECNTKLHGEFWHLAYFADQNRKPWLGKHLICQVQCL